MRKPTIIAGLATAAVLVVGGGAAFAATQTPAPSTTTTTTPETGTSTATPSISREQAEKTALAKVPGGKLTPSESAELETEHGVLVWEIEVTAPGGVEHEISVDAAKGAVVSDEVDHDDQGENDHDDD